MSEVRIGLLRVEERSLSALSELAARLQAEERQRLFLLHRADDRFNFAAGRALARKVLDQVKDPPDDGWVFEQGVTGKPVLRSRPAANLDFSIAHAAGMVAVAVCTDHAVGIDVENTRTAVDLHGIASLCFSPAETERLNHEPDEKRASLFFSLWVIKEACGKAQHTGLSAPLCDLSAHLDALIAGAPATLHVGEWSVQHSQPSAEHSLAVAVRNERLGRTAWIQKEFSVEELLRQDR